MSGSKTRSQRKPSRFLDLPREMQTEILGHADFDTVKQLSLCSRRAQTSTVRLSRNPDSERRTGTDCSRKLSTLFRRVRYSTYASSSSFPQPIVPFPVYASEHVQHFHFSLPIVSRNHSDAGSVAHAIAVQLGALSALEHLQSVLLSIHFLALSHMHELERPVSVI